MATLNPTSMTTATTSAPQSGSGVSIQEFKIRVPKNLRKKHHVMRFNATLNVDFAQWSQVKMERENNMKEFKGMDDDQPKFGAGSEFGREAREEARRKKFGIVSRKYKPDDQPWILKVGGKNGKKFKGIREGGVSENAAYYVFTHAPDGAIDAYPLYEWYNFQPIQRYKALSAEEAEQEFGRRNKVLNYFNLMFRKRMRGDEAEGEVEDPDDKKAKNSKSKELKISDMDEWMDSDDNSSDSAEDKDKDKDKDKEDSDSNSKKKKNKKKAAAAKKKKKVQDEAGEESDDGDEEGRERDYISDSSESESDREGKANKELKSVAEEDALRKLLTSDEDSDEEEKQKSSDEESKKEANEKAKAEKGESSNKKDKAEKDTSSDLSSDSDNDAPPKKSKGSAKSSANSRSNTPIPSTSSNASKSNASKSNASHAASLAGTASSGPPSKKPRFDPNPGGDNGVTEQAVRRYLARKPMTTTELLTKFKQRKSGVSSDRLVETMTQILKKINPVKQMIKGKMYLSIKP